MTEKTEHFEKVVVPEDVRFGLRADQFLCSIFCDKSRAYLQRAIQRGTTLMNGQAFRSSVMVRPGDEFVVDLSEALPPAKPMAEDVPLDILFEDEHLLVIHKPAGLVVHPAQGNWHGTLVNRLMAYCGGAEDFNEMVDEGQRPGIVHRLDKDTSGVLVIAKNAASQEKLKDMFREHTLKKIYLTIILGEMREAQGRIELPIARHPYNRVKMAVVMDGGREACTDYRTVAVSHGCSLVMVRIHTGRTHQIRVHFSHYGHPVLGDPVYGGCPHNTPYEAPRQMLHAWKLSFQHPMTGEALAFKAPIPEDFESALTALELKMPVEKQD